jgi:hypothetical protein
MFKEIKAEGYFHRLKPVLSRRQALLSALIILFLVPYPTTVVPEWRVRVVDEVGRPYAEMEVSQGWKNYSLELEDGENMETGRTDGDGYVTFPKRTFWAGLLSRGFRRAFTTAMSIAHGGGGIHADIATTGPQGYKSVEYMPDKPPPPELVLPH